MAKQNLEKFFDKYLGKEPLFVDKRVLQSNYIPEHIPHRKEEIENVASILAPALRLDKPSNLFCYGKTGSGKTICVKYVMEQMQEIAKKKKLKLDFYYLNCKLKRVADTEYRLIAQLARDFGMNIPPTGLPTDEVYRIFGIYSV